MDIPSPTGEERPLAEHLAAVMVEAGLDGRTQSIDDGQANAYGRARGDGTGADLLLYSPIDTVTTGNKDVDLPWAGPALAPHLQPKAIVDEDLVAGLGAGNPKGHAACVLHAVELLNASGIALRGDVIAGFGAGGMPSNARPGQRGNVGQGAGCSFLLEQGVHPDFAVIAKPTTGVLYEEVGLAWFDVTVAGTHTYVGSRHLIPYRSANADAARLISRLEEWFPSYAARHTTGQVAPQGVVSSVRSGWSWTAAFTPAVCQFRLDLRLSPRTTPATARREFAAALADVAGDLGVTASSEMVLAIAGGVTDPESWVVRSTVHAWAAEHDRPHEFPAALSGATDANILRSRGVPTARVGMPKVDGVTDFGEGMNTVSVNAMAQLTRILIRVALDTCTRPAEEVL